MRDFKVVIPEEKHSVIQFIQENLPGVGVVNSNLKNFEPKEVFAWHLSIMMEFEELIDKGMPYQKEREIIEPFAELLDKVVKGNDSSKPNALFLARLTWNATQEFIWRVHNPEIANVELQSIVASDSVPRELDYRMEEDANWSLAQWHLDACNA